MIKETFKRTIKKLSPIILSISTFILTAPVTVFADDTQITTHTPQEVAKNIFTANKGIATAFGGALIGIAVVVVGIKMLMTNKKQDARSEGMDSILTIILAACLIGGFTLFAGLFLSIGGGTAAPSTTN